MVAAGSLNGKLKPDPAVAAYRNLTFAKTDTIGVGGQVIYEGWLQSKELDPRLSGQRRYQTYSELVANSTITATGLRHMLGLIVKPSWKWEPADDSSEAERLAELVEAIVEDIATPWANVVKSIALFKWYGFSINEWTAKLRDDGVVGILDIEPRPQVTIERWFTERSGAVLAVIQRDPQTGTPIVIPRGKMVYAVDNTLDHTPEGMGLLRHVVQAATSLERYEQLEGFGFETDLRGVPIARAPLAAMQELVDSNAAGWDASRVASMLAPIKDFLQHHIKNPKLSLLLESRTYQTTDERQSPSSVPMWGLDVVRGGTTSQEACAQAITRINVEIARMLGAEHLLLGADGSGSLAMSRDKSENVAMLVDGVLAEISAAVKRDLVRPIFRMNGWDEALMPTPKTETAQLRDVEQVTAALRDLAQAGAVLGPGDPIVNAVRRRLGMPDEVEQTPAMVDAMIGGGKPPPPSGPGADAETEDQPKTDRQAAAEQDAGEAA